MEGFTIVLLTGWLLLLGSFIGMYFLDQATKQAAERRAASAGQTPEKNR
ncbi:MAG: hypothetical protein HY316_09975 [Acidobacteria bacterium]|nr:hypothetical protein [Acidobacteriota bacterium]